MCLDVFLAIYQYTCLFSCPFFSYLLLTHYPSHIFPPLSYGGGGVREGLCRPVSRSHSERWPHWTVGNRIQLCCRRRVCVQECTRLRLLVRSLPLCSTGCTSDLFCVSLTAALRFYRQFDAICGLSCRFAHQQRVPHLPVTQLRWKEMF